MITKDLSNIIEAYTNTLNVTADMRKQLNDTLLLSSINIIRYLKNMPVNYNTDINADLKEQIINRYTNILAKYEVTTGYHIDKKIMSELMAHYQIYYNIPFKTLKDIVMYGSLDKILPDELTKAIENVVL